MKYIFSLGLFFFIITNAFSQSKYEALFDKNEIQCYYKIKKVKNDQNRIYLKFKNKSSSHQNVELNIGLYLNGVMEEEAQIDLCLKKGFFSNLLAKPQTVINEQIQEKELMSDDFSLEVIDLKSNTIDDCETRPQ